MKKMSYRNVSQEICERICSNEDFEIEFIPKIQMNHIYPLSFLQLKIDTIGK